MIDPNDFSAMCSNPTVVAEACRQPCEPGPAPELPDDLTPIDDAFLNRVRMLASFV